MEKRQLSDLIAAVGGTVCCGDPNQTVSEISTDTRNITAGSLFVPIRGERFDGHDFIPQAFAAGAVAVLSEHPAEGGCVILVPDTAKAYLQLAAWYRRQFDLTVVGVTGSVGKTTTKEMIATVLESRYQTLKTEGNFNNEIGLPRTLFRLSDRDEMAVIEMGMSHFGEIRRLAETAAPNIGVITNVGVSHIENLGSREGILQAKLELLDGMSPDAPLLLNLDNDLLSQVAKTLDRRVITYGIDGQGADISACHICEAELTTEFDIIHQGEQTHVVLPAVGRHNVQNALVAYGVGRLVGIDPTAIAEALGRYTPTGMRQRIVRQNGFCVIADCYNASPDSMRAALGVLSTIPCEGRRIAVLGDMLELGDYAKQAHTQVGEMVAATAPDALFCIGKDAADIRAGAEAAGFCNGFYYADRQALVDAVKEYVTAGDCLLFKASRGMKLEELMEQICGSWTR